MGLVVVNELMTVCGYSDRTSIVKYVKSLSQVTSLEKKKIQGKHSGQAVWTVSSKDAELIIASTKQGVSSAYEVGVFYLIQLLPDIAPKRIKVGFSANVQERLRTHKTTSPDAVIKETWPCKRSWEGCAIQALKNHGDVTPVGIEVFDSEDISYTVERLNLFFSWLNTAQ